MGSRSVQAQQRAGAVRTNSPPRGEQAKAPASAATTQFSSARRLIVASILALITRETAAPTLAPMRPRAFNQAKRSRTVSSEPTGVGSRTNAQLNANPGSPSPTSDYAPSPMPLPAAAA